MSTRRWFAFTSLIIVLGLAATCSWWSKEEPRDEIGIVGAGATFPYPLYKVWIQKYTEAHAGVKISYDPVGSGEGVRRFIAREVDFGASDAAMTDEEMSRVDRGVKLVPATAGIIVLAYNLKDVEGVLRLPRDVYAGIFAGNVRRWDDAAIKRANPGMKLPGLDIVLVTRADASGTTFAFTNHLAAVDKGWRDRGPGVGKVVRWPVNTMSARGNEGVAGRIGITNGSIGYVEYGYAMRAGLAMAALENSAGSYVEPSPERGRETLNNTRAEMPANRRVFFPDPGGENSYPIVTYSWLLLYANHPDPKKTAVLNNFVRWGLTEGQKYSEELGFCPLPAGIADLSSRDLAESR